MGVSERGGVRKRDLLPEPNYNCYISYRKKKPKRITRNISISIIK
jgi:hypothetical protein